MVSTRQHPRGDFPATEPSPTKRQSRTSTPLPTDSPDLSSSSPSFKAESRRVVSHARDIANNSIEVAKPPAPADIGESQWCHSVSNITVAWLAISIPLVFWDCLYILLRPHTFEGGALQWPIWKPYEIYAAIDKVYSRSAWDTNEGFGGAQGVLNAVELVMYGLYAMIVYNHSVAAPSGTGLEVKSGEQTGALAWLSGGRKIRGSVGNRAVILGFAASVMTCSKTILYYFNEYFSNFNSVRHNDWFTLCLFYGVMNGLWVVFPAYMTVVFGSDIVAGLDLTAGASSKKTL